MEEKNVKVTQLYGHPAAACVFIFTSITTCFWAAYSGWIPAESQPLSMGVMQVTLAPAWLACAIVMLKLGDALNGVIFVIFSSNTDRSIST